MILLSGITGERDLRQARVNLTKGCEEGVTAACVALGDMYMSGSGVEPDEKVRLLIWLSDRLGVDVAAGGNLIAIRTTCGLSGSSEPPYTPGYWGVCSGD